MASRPTNQSKSRKVSRAVVINEQYLLVIKRNRYGEKFYVLPGGGIDIGESPEETAVRETWEESSIKVKPVRHIYTYISPDGRFGNTTYYLCEFISGEPGVRQGTNEAEGNLQGENTYSPMWLELSKLLKANFFPTEVKRQLLVDINSDFPKSVITLGRNE